MEVLMLYVSIFIDLFFIWIFIDLFEVLFTYFIIMLLDFN